MLNDESWLVDDFLVSLDIWMSIIDRYIFFAVADGNRLGFRLVPPTLMSITKK